MGILDIPADKLQETLDASTEKFCGHYDKQGNLVLEEVGLLRDAQIIPGDVLKSIYPLGRGGFEMSDKEGRKEILTWNFTSRILRIVIERDGVQMTKVLKNPAAKS